MKNGMYIMLAPFQLKDGTSEAQLLEASKMFQENFVDKQRGISKRILLRAAHGGYADLVFFDSKGDAERVVEAEATSEHCATFFQIMLPPDPNLPDMGVLSFEHVKTYE
jgi:hypothetical protein